VTVSCLPRFAQPYRVVCNATIEAFFEGRTARSDVRSWGDLPLYRQSAILERETGIELSRATLDSWVMQVGELLRPITAAMGQELLSGGESIVHYACWPHVRRKFFDAVKLGHDRPTVSIPNSELTFGNKFAT
jgi:Transposase IS66 family